MLLLVASVKLWGDIYSSLILNVDEAWGRENQGGQDKHV